MIKTELLSLRLQNVYQNKSGLNKVVRNASQPNEAT